MQLSYYKNEQHGWNKYDYGTADKRSENSGKCDLLTFSEGDSRKERSSKNGRIFATRRVPHTGPALPVFYVAPSSTLFVHELFSSSLPVY